MPATADPAIDLAGALRLLADPTRLEIVRALAAAPGGELHVTAICAAFTMTQPAVSYHLAQLRVAGLVGCRRDGKRNLYRVRADALAAIAADLAALAGVPVS